MRLVKLGFHDVCILAGGEAKLPRDPLYRVVRACKLGDHANVADTGLRVNVQKFRGIVGSRFFSELTDCFGQEAMRQVLQPGRAHCRGSEGRGLCRKPSGLHQASARGPNPKCRSEDKRKFSADLQLPRTGRPPLGLEFGTPSRERRRPPALDSAQLLCRQASCPTQLQMYGMEQRHASQPNCKSRFQALKREAAAGLAATECPMRIRLGSRRDDKTKRSRAKRCILHGRRQGCKAPAGPTRHHPSRSRGQSPRTSSGGPLSVGPSLDSGQFLQASGVKRKARADGAVGPRKHKRKM